MKNKFIERDILYPEAKKLALKTKDLTIAKIQEKLKTGFARSAGLMDMLKMDGVIKIKNEKIPSSVKLDKVYADKDWHEFKNSPVVPLGYKIISPTENLVIDLSNVVFNLLVGGKESSIRNNFLNCTISSLLKNSRRESIKFIIIGKKKSELALYRGIPNFLFPFISDFNNAKEATQWCISEIDRRLQLSCDHTGTFNEYNKELKEKMPRIVVIVEELDSLMGSDQKFFKKAFEKINVFSSIVNINFVVGVSRPSNIKIMPKKIIKGFFYRMTFTTISPSDSDIMIGHKGAEKLKKQEILYSYGKTKEEALHMGSFCISKDEIKSGIKRSYIK